MHSVVLLVSITISMNKHQYHLTTMKGGDLTVAGFPVYYGRGAQTLLCVAWVSPASPDAGVGECIQLSWPL